MSSCPTRHWARSLCPAAGAAGAHTARPRVTDLAHGTLINAADLGYALAIKENVGASTKRHCGCWRTAQTRQQKWFAEKREPESPIGCGASS